LPLFAICAKKKGSIMTSNKVISFKKMTSGLEIAASRDILWPCNCFTVSIPRRAKDRLNVFEETVLALTSLSSGDTEELAKTSCLKEDLVSFIQNRLALNGFLDSRMEITESGKAVLKKMEKDEDKDYVSARFFVDLIKGTILPFVHTGTMEYKLIVEHSENFICFKINPTDDKYKKVPLIKCNDGYRSKQPNASDVIQAIRAFKARFRRYAAFTGNTGAYPPSVPTESAITIGGAPEPVFLHCEAFIQKSYPDTVVVTDGFDFGYSDVFANYLMESDRNDIKRIRQRLRENARIQLSVTENGRIEKSEHTPKNHRIARLLNDADNILEENGKLKLTGTSIEKEAYKNLRKALIKIYDALERTFSHVVFDFPVSDWESIYERQSFEDNNEILVSFAKKLNLIVNERNRSILEVKKGSLRNLNDSNLKMQSTLALAITGAAQSVNHPFNQLALRYPAILGTICRFKTLRDGIQHGKTKMNKLSNNVRDYLKITKNIIEILLPNISKQFNVNVESNKRNGSDIEKIYQINQERLGAIIELDEYFGAALIHRLNPDLKDLLIQISMMAGQSDFNDDILQIGITNFASALQIMYHEVIVAFNTLGADDESAGNIKSGAFGKAVRNGFVSNIRDIPPVINGVLPEKIKLVVKGNTYSIQANFIGLLYVCKDELLEKIHNGCPDLLLLTAEIAELRGHGNRDFSINNGGGGISRDKFLILKDGVFKAIKTLMGVL
jgi:hypothetical protein